MTIAIVGGTGPEGSGLALRWAQAGETIIIGSRDAQRASEAADKLREKTGGKLSGAENKAACESAGIIVLTIPFEGRERWWPRHSHAWRLAGFCSATNRRARAGRCFRSRGISQHLVGRLASRGPRGLRCDRL